MFASKWLLLVVSVGFLQCGKCRALQQTQRHCHWRVSMFSSESIIGKSALASILLSHSRTTPHVFALFFNLFRIQCHWKPSSGRACLPFTSLSECHWWPLLCWMFNIPVGCSSTLNQVVPFVFFFSSQATNHFCIQTYKLDPRMAAWRYLLHSAVWQGLSLPAGSSFTLAVLVAAAIR